ncbi:MAG: hypothetical protein O7D91_11755 [Planctomycetota bacterium]|nr:hypothetical protein [Planctomycetota bacterium]
MMRRKVWFAAVVGASLVGGGGGAVSEAPEGLGPQEIHLTNFEFDCGTQAPGIFLAQFLEGVARGEVPDPSIAPLPEVAPRQEPLMMGVGPLGPDDLFLFEDTAGLLLTNYTSAQRNVLMVQAANAVLAAHGDNFDFIGFWLNFVPHHQFGAAFYLGVENDVSGIGLSIFNLRTSYGLAGDNIEGFVMMWNVNDWVPGSSSAADFTRLVLGQEFEHRFAMFLSPISGNRSLQGAAGCGRSAHWNFKVDGQGSAMEIAQWTGSSPAIRVGGSLNFNADIVGGVFSYADLYLMGYVSPAEMDAGNFELRYMDNNCNSPYGGSISNFGSAEIIAANGARAPGSASAQKDFRTAWIMIHQAGAAPSSADINRALGIMEQHQADWSFSTLARGTMDNSIGGEGDLPDLVGCAFQMLHNPVDAGDSFDPFINYEICNGGAVPAGEFHVDWYLSTDSTISTSDCLLTGASIVGIPAGGTTGLLPEMLTLPQTCDPCYSGDGTYYIGMILDTDNTVPESDENNNNNVGEGLDLAPVVIDNTCCSCDDGDLCNGEEVCVGGTCQEGTPLDCDDRNPCTDDDCDPAIGCVNTPNDANSCDDGDLCNGEEVCVGGTCQEGTPLDCDDSNPCTDDDCDPATGCVNTPNDANSCDDGDLCNGEEVCVGGTCQEGTPLDCDDGLFCNGPETCDPELGCQPGSLPCASDCCENTGTCEPCPCTSDEDCSALDDQCNVGVCNVDAGACESQPGNEGEACDDGNACTENDACTNGECAGTTVDCDDGDACTTDACDGGACTHTPLDCDDGIDCTDDTCVDGTCRHEPLTDDNDEDGEPNCSDGCPDDPNKTSPGECGCGVPEGTCGGGGGGGGGGGSCGTCADDGLFCTGDPVCTNGTCQFTGNPCGGDTPVCCEASGSCVSECCSDTDCDDGDACTDDRCDPFSGCLHDAHDCDDGDVCNGSETCQAGNCVSGTPLDCGDGDACTNDSCTDGKCVHDPIDCEDVDACTLDGCDPDTGCTHDAIDCADEDLCTTDTCQDGECLHAPIDCDDGDLCTQDACANGVCEHNAIICPEGQVCDDGVCASIVQLEPGDPCVDDAQCNDGLLCNGIETCDAGTCVEGAPPCEASECCDEILGCYDPQLCGAGCACTPQAPTFGLIFLSLVGWRFGRRRGSGEP